MPKPPADARAAAAPVPRRWPWPNSCARVFAIQAETVTEADARCLHDFLDVWAERQPDVEFAVHGPRWLTYRQARLVMNRLANAFVSAGLRPGDRIAVLAKNCVEYPLIYFAASRVGVVPVPLNYRSAPPEWRYIVQDAEARLLLVGRWFFEAVDAIRDRVRARMLEAKAASEAQIDAFDRAFDDPLFWLLTARWSACGGRKPAG